MVNVGNSYVSTPPIDGGVAFRAPLGTPLPTSVLDTPDVAFLDHGAIGDDGLSFKVDRKAKDIEMMGGEIFRSLQESFASEVTLEFLESENINVLKTVFGDANVEVGTATVDGVEVKTYITSTPLPISAWVLKCIDGNKTKGWVIERGQPLDLKEFKATHKDVTRFQLTIKCYRSSSPKGETILQLMNDGDQAVTS